MITDPLVIAICLLAAAAGGVVKGVSGFGLPMVAVPLMAHFVPAPAAMALLSVPIVASNVLQAANAGVLARIGLRLWPLYAMVVVGIVAGTRVLVSVSPRTLDLVVGGSMLAAAAARLARPSFAVAPRAERWAGPAVGLFAGFLGGVSSMFGPPIIVYLNMLRVPKDEFVVGLSAAYVIGVVPLNLALVEHGWLGRWELALSCAIVLPVALGMGLGRLLRDRMSSRGFEWLVLFVLVLSGFSLLVRGASG